MSTKAIAAVLARQEPDALPTAARRDVYEALAELEAIRKAAKVVASSPLSKAEIRQVAMLMKSIAKEAP